MLVLLWTIGIPGPEPCVGAADTHCLSLLRFSLERAAEELCYCSFK